MSSKTVMSAVAGKACFVFFFIALLSGCAGIRGELDEQGFAAADRVPTQEVAAVADEPVDDNPAANEIFDFHATELLRGATLPGQDLLGQPAIMTFITPDCEFTAEAGADLAAAAERNPDVLFVVVHGHGSVEEHVAFVEEVDLLADNVIHIDDTEGSLSNRLGINAFPSSVLITDDQAISVAEGHLDHDGYGRAIGIVVGDAV